MYRSRGLLGALTVLMLSLACGESADTPVTPPGNPLEGVSLSIGTATSFGRVEILGLPQTRGAISELQLLLLPEDGSEVDLPLDTEEDVTFFWAPLHPETPNAGGTARLVVDDGENRSPELPLDLEPLPDAPGAFASLVATLREHVEQRATWAGTSFEELQSQSFEAVEPSLLPLKIAQSTIDSPDEDKDMTDLVTNEIGFMTDEEQELLDRLVGFSGLEGLLRSEIEDFEAEAPESLRVGDTAPRATVPSSGTCFNIGPDISTAQELANAMLLSALADLYTSPDGPGGQELTNIGIAIGAVGTIPGLGIPAAVVGVGVAAWQASGQYIGGVYPSSFVSLDFDIDRTAFPEDDPGFAQWENVEVVAMSRGWVADQSIAFIVVSALGGALSAGSSATILESEILRDMLVNDINVGLGAFLSTFDGGIVEFCPQQWTVDITDLPFSTAQALNARLDVDAATRQVRPKETGDDFLRVAAQSSQYGGREIHKDLPMRVNPIIIDVAPSSIIVESAGDVVMVTATIQNADNESLLWETEQGVWDDGIGSETNGPTTRPLKTPTSENAYPFSITVESLSRQGIRESGEPRRFDFATVRLDEKKIVISPSYECVGNDETVQFEAEVTGVENPEVRWRIESGYGTINELTGLYTAPPTGSTDDVIVAEVLDQDEPLEDSAEVQVGACTCFYDLTISNAAQWHVSGGDIAHTILAPGGEGILQWIIMFPDSEPENRVFGASFAASPFPQPGNTGSFAANVTFTNGARSWSAGQLDDDHLGMTFTIEEFTPTLLRGTLFGTAVERDPNDPDIILTTIIVEMTIRSGLFDGSWPCGD